MDLSDLNPEQREAVETLNGPVLVLAGAGTGKTRVITYRIANLLHHGVASENVLAVTFTNKAANEMRERIGQLVRGGRGKGLTVCTFHAFGLRLLRENCARAGLAPRFSIYGTGDQLSLLREALSEVAAAGLNPDAFQILGAISRAKNAGVAPGDMRSLAATDWDVLAGRCYGKYQEKLRARNAVDFDDLILMPLKLLKNDSSVRSHCQERFKYVLIDEYQDTNDAQHEMVRLLGAAHGNVCAVGDDDQSIYTWRGAKPDNVLRFQRDFPRVKLVKLERNYRSTQPILDVANEIIRHSAQRIAKRLHTDRKGGVPVEYYEVEDEIAEVQLVVGAIRDNHLRKKVPLGDHAILYRTNAQSRLFEEKLREQRVPYVIVGGQSFYEQREVQDVLAYLRTLANPGDDISFRRILNTPARGIGPKAVTTLEQIAGQRKCSMREALSAAAADTTLPKALHAPLERFDAALRKWTESMTTGRRADALGQILDQIGYQDELVRIYREDNAAQRWESVQELVNSLAQFEESGKGELTDFLASAALLERDTETDNDLRPDALTLITIHSCKGLEFRNVYLVGCEEGILPHRRSLGEEQCMESLEEERRLCYVAVTRARERLTLVRAKTRSKRALNVDTVLSRFFSEMPSGLLTKRLDGKLETGEDRAEIAQDYFARMRERLGRPKEEGV